MHKDFAKILKQHLDFRGIEKGTKAFFEWVALLKLDISEEYGPKAYYESLARLNGGAKRWTAAELGALGFTPRLVQTILKALAEPEPTEPVRRVIYR